MVIGLTLLVALAGVLMYAFCTNPKLADIGRIMFAAGVLAFLLSGSPRLIELIR
jgi:hypothetical protein